MIRLTFATALLLALPAAAQDAPRPCDRAQGTCCCTLANGLQCCGTAQNCESGVVSGCDCPDREEQG